MTNEKAIAVLEEGVLSGKTDTPENNEALDAAILALKFAKALDINLQEGYQSCNECEHLNLPMADPTCADCTRLIHFNFRRRTE